MNDFVIVTDSCVDLPNSLANELELVILPLTVSVEGKEYRNFLDEREITIKAFYQLLRDHVKTTTAQATPMQFHDVFEPVLKAGKNVLSISFSSQLSGTYQSSVIAKKELQEDYPNQTIITIDSTCASMGQGLLLTYAAKMRQAGKSIEEVAAWVENNKTRISHLFTVSDLGHLRRGGRLSAGKEILGNLLNVKPLLHVSLEGKLVAYGKARGRFKSLNELVHRMEETYDKSIKQTVYISHGDSLDDANYVKKIILEKFELSEEDIVVNPIGPVIGSHSGVDTIAIFYLGNERTA